MRIFIKKTLTASAVMAASLFVSASSAMAITSCWDAPDPPGCTLQCWFGGPCPLEQVRAKGPVIGFKLPDGSGKGAEEFRAALLKFDPIKGETVNTIRKEFSGRVKTQTCAPDDLLDVLTKAVSTSKEHRQAAAMVAKACFK